MEGRNVNLYQSSPIGGPETQFECKGGARSCHWDELDCAEEREPPTYITWADASGLGSHTHGDKDEPHYRTNNNKDHTSLLLLLLLCGCALLAFYVRHGSFR